MEGNNDSSIAENKETPFEAAVKSIIVNDNEAQICTNLEKEVKMSESIPVEEKVTLPKIKLDVSESRTLDEHFEEALFVPEVDNETEVTNTPEEEFVQHNPESEDPDSITFEETSSNKAGSAINEVIEETRDDPTDDLSATGSPSTTPGKEGSEENHTTTASCKLEEYKVSVWTENGDNVGFCSPLPSFTSHFQERQPSKVHSYFQKQHNLSVAELRKKLAYCPVCQTQHHSHKTANSCLARHGKRQCWLCLDILSSKKDEFYRHCTDFHSISKTGDIVGCPFCGKFFDFRQGLNQHIVKIHFAENILDVDAVASLSPASLVDIFTGKPRGSCDETQYLQHQQIVSQSTEPLDAITVGDITTTDNERKNISLETLFPRSNTDPNSLQREGIVNSPQQSHCNSDDGNFSTEVAPEIAHSVPRPSVITQLLHTAQKMNVPPEQTLSSLNSEIESGLPSNYCPLLKQSLQDKGEMFVVPRKVEVLKNPTLQFQTYKDLYPFPKTSTPLSLPMIVTSDPEKFDQATFLLSSSDKTASQECPSNIELGESDYESYEQVITRINQNLYQSDSQIYDSQSSSPVGNQQSVDKHETFVDLGEAGYYGSMGSILKSLADLDHQKTFDSLNDATLSGKSQGLTSPAGYDKNGTSLNQEMELSSSPPKSFPDNCGVKRRILMKAMWDEQQCKKPATTTTVASTHALVRDLHAAVANLSAPPPRKKTMTFNRGYCEDSPLSRSGHATSQQQGPLENMSPFFSQYVKQDAGPFFEQYVRQDRTCQANPLKILDLARVPAPRENTSKARVENIAAWNAQESLASTATGQCQYLPSCARQEPTTLTSGSLLSNIGPNSTNQQQSLNNSNVVAKIPSGYTRGRKPPNPAFWDGLRARLILSQNLHHRGRSFKMPGNIPRPIFQPHTNFVDCRYGRPSRRENVVIQNPFEDESNSQNGLRRATLSSTTSTTVNDSEGFRVPGRENILSQPKRAPAIRSVEPFSNFRFTSFPPQPPMDFQQPGLQGMNYVLPTFPPPPPGQNTWMGKPDTFEFPTLQQHFMTTSHPHPLHQQEEIMSTQQDITSPSVYSPRHTRGYRTFNQLRNQDKSNEST